MNDDINRIESSETLDLCVAIHDDEILSSEIS
jgi:hypothetical protein